MEYLLAALPVILLVVFVGVWQKLRRVYRRRLDWEASMRAHEGLDDLLAMKGKLTEEEYRRLRQAVIHKMTQGLEEGKSVSKQVSLAELEDQLRRQQANGQSSRAVE